MATQSRNIKKVDMTDKEKADCLLELHKTQLSHFSQTRDIEFRVNIALWTLIAASGSFLYGKVQLDDNVSYFIYAIVSLAIFLGHLFLWMMPIQNSEDMDDYFINQYRMQIEKLSGFSLEVPSLVKRPRILWALTKILRKDGWSWILAESGITLALLVVVGILLSVV